MSEGEAGVRMQCQVRDNAADLQTFLSEMAEWERDARDRETKIKGGESHTQNKKVRPLSDRWWFSRFTAFKFASIRSLRISPR